MTAVSQGCLPLLRWLVFPPFISTANFPVSYGSRLCAKVGVPAAWHPHHPRELCAEVGEQRQPSKATRLRSSVVTYQRRHGIISGRLVHFAYLTVHHACQSGYRVKSRQLNKLGSASARDDGGPLTTPTHTNHDSYCSETELAVEPSGPSRGPCGTNGADGGRLPSRQRCGWRVPS